jgi:hypothetical protein
MFNAVKTTGIVVVVMFMAIATSCSNKTSENEHNTKEYTSEYVCPMHCEGSGDSKPGVCPTCGMNYVKNEKNNK